MAGKKLGLILASASPRRAELLANARIRFEVCPAEIDERRKPREPARAYAERLAREKAEAVAAKFPGRVILGADTVVVAGKSILGKPRDAAHAMRMLRLLSGRSHAVITGVCLLTPVERRAIRKTRIKSQKAFVTDVRSATTKVVFNRISDSEIAAYAAGGEPRDKAGAYAIQGMASRWAQKISGCYFNVVGLPVPLVAQLLRRRGYL